MKITIIACGFSIDNGKPTQRGACAAHLSYEDEHDRKATRTISELVGSSTNPQCDLKAAILGLMSVRVGLRKRPIELIASSYVAPILERDGDNYKLNPKKNLELVKRLREKVALFGDLTVKAGTKDQLRPALDAAKVAVDTEAGSDSGTVVL